MKRKLSRREFVTLVAGAGASTLLAACAPAAPEEPAAAPTERMPTSSSRGGFSSAIAEP